MAFKFPKAKANVTGERSQRFWLAVHPPGQGDDSYWEITADDIRQADSIPPEAHPVYSLSEDDLRVLAVKPLSSARAKSLIRQNSGQPSRVINHSKQGVVYGRAVGNVCESVVCSRYPSVAQALEWLDQFAPARMSGTGSCIFAAFLEQAQAHSILRRLPEHWQGFVAQGKNRSPLLKSLK